MATAVEAKITVDGNKLDGFISLSVRQNIFLHNTFDLYTRSDALERFSSSADTFVVDKAQKLIGKKITIELTPDTSKSKSKSAVIFKGVILEVQGIKYQDAYSGSILFRGSSMDINHDSTTYCRSFKDKSIDDIVKQVSSDYPSNLFSKTSISSRYKEVLPYVVQYNETNFEFIRRLAKMYGEWFLVTGENQFFFGDPPENKTQLLHGLDLHEFSFSMKMAPVKFTYTNYSYFKEETIEKNSSAAQPRTDNYMKQSLNASDDLYTVEEKYHHNFPLSKDHPRL